MHTVLAAIFICLLKISSGKHWKLVFEDTFDKLDISKWDHEVTTWGGGNGEFQIYTTDPANTYVKNNTLFIKPTLTKDNINPSTKKPFGEDFLYNGKLNLVEMYGKCTTDLNWGCTREGKYGIILPTMSGRIRTKERFSFKYGRLEVVAKLPVGDWMWPAIWLLPETNVYGGWPRSGEIDLIEGRGNRDLRSKEGLIGIQRVGSALHWGPKWDVNKYALTVDAKTNVSYNFGDYFHKFELDWDENGMRFIVDGDEYVTFPSPLVDKNSNWKGFWDYGLQNDGMGGLENPWVNGTLVTPFDEKFHLLLNVAVGGTNGYFPEDAVNNGNEPKPWNNTGPGNKAEQFWKAKDKWAPTWKGENAAMQVKSVRVYQMDPNPLPPAATVKVIPACPTQGTVNKAPVIQGQISLVLAIIVSSLVYFC